MEDPMALALGVDTGGTYTDAVLIRDERENRFGQVSDHTRGSSDWGRQSDLAVMDDAAFRAKFSGSPIKRIGRDRFVRNVLYAIGNSDTPGFIPVAKDLCEDDDPVVADAARWAVRRLSEK